MPYSKQQQNEFNKIRKELGSPVFPPIKECKEYFDKLNADDSFFWVYNLKDDRVTFRKGIKEHLGYDEYIELNTYSLSKMIPENRRKLYLPQNIASYKIAFEYEPKDDLKKGLIHLYSNAAWTHKNGNIIYTFQQSKPFQFDRKGNMVSNISWHHIKRNHLNENEPQGGKFLINKKVSEVPNATLKQLETMLSKTRIRFIDNYPFSKREQEVIWQLFALQKRELSENEKNKILAKFFNRSIRTIEGYRRTVQAKASDFFNIKFPTFTHVLERLHQENLVFF